MAAIARCACVALVGLMLFGCRGERTAEPPIVPIRNMHDQPRYDPHDVSHFFQDGRTMRPLPPHTVSREMEVDLSVATGRVNGDESLSGEWVTVIPDAVSQRAGGTEPMLRRGQERYGIYCAPCHGLTGAGDGMVARRAMQVGASSLAPPTFHEDRLRGIPDGQVFATITNGIRNMPSYAHSIPVDDRWAIVGYLRALQLSQQSAAQAMNTQVNP
ncbi:MAG: cytochrome c [Myxococcota bacterium]